MRFKPHYIAKFICILLSILLLFYKNVSSQNYYFGDLHVHTNLSDGKANPQDIYNYAKNESKIDFISVTDHDIYPSDNSAKWSEMQYHANRNNDEGRFVTFI